MLFDVKFEMDSDWSEGVSVGPLGGRSDDVCKMDGKHDRDAL